MWRLMMSRHARPINVAKPRGRTTLDRPVRRQTKGLLWPPGTLVVR